MIYNDLISSVQTVGEVVEKESHQLKYRKK